MISVIEAKRTYNARPEMIWPILSDTATLNRTMGLAPMSFQTIEGIRHGRQKVMGLNLRWTEEPWEWLHNSWLRNERIYQSGFFQNLRGHFQLIPQGVNQTEIRLEFRITHRYPWLATLLNMATRGIQTKMLVQIEKMLTQQTFSSTLPTTPKYHSLIQWLEQTPVPHKARIRPKTCANELAQRWDRLLSEALGPSFKNRLSLRFDAVCPHCRGAKQSVGRLTDLPAKVRCESCEIDFDTGTQESIEISLRDLSLSSEALAVDFCSADVVHKPTVVLQRLGGNWQERLNLPRGIYGLKSRGYPQTQVLLVESGGSPLSIQLHAQPTFTLEPLRCNGDLLLDAQGLERHHLVMLEKMDNDRGALLLAELFTHPQLSELVPPAALISSFPLEMGQKALLFTDVVGSTELYFRVGDLEAFRQVRESFLLIGKVASKHQGYLVKTIGDATMYAFQSSEEALKAAIELQEINRENELKLRASLHCGPCLTLTTSDGPDFFGDTINVCAKFQSEAEAGQVVFSQEIARELSSEHWSTWSAHCEKILFKLKGPSQRHFELYRLTFS